jgi:hypothetical protein
MLTQGDQPIDFQLYYRARPGEAYRDGDPMRPAGGVIQYPRSRLRIDTAAHTRETFDMIFEFGNEQGLPLLPRSLSVGDVICVWLNPYGQRRYYAVDGHDFRLVDARPFKALVRAQNLPSLGRQVLPARRPSSNARASRQRLFARPARGAASTGVVTDHGSILAGANQRA